MHLRFDPTGGAGLQADVETVTAVGMRAVCAQTCNTLQNDDGVEAVMPTPAAMLLQQIESLRGAFTIAAVKIGAVASAENAEAIARGLTKIICPLIVDPVLRDATGKPLGDKTTARAIREYLLPATTCATPNREELLSLVPEAATPDIAATTLLEEGCGAILATSQEKRQGTLRHVLHRPGTAGWDFLSKQLPGEFHGSGCTLSSALATYIALGNPLHRAIDQALAFTARALGNATMPERGRKRRFPGRWPHVPD